MPSSDPIARFADALSRAEKSEPDVPNAVALATADAQGRPSVRMVLLQSVDERGFVFHTNYRSRKGFEIGENPHAALCFHWKSLREQVRVEGTVARLEPEASDAYFRARPRESQLAAIASEQSAPLASREALEARFAELDAQYRDRLPERPSHWGGYRLYPTRIEFWYHGEHRLHHRELYERVGDGWRVTLLNP